MIRALLAFLLVPLAWPWIAWPAINSGFRVLSYGKLDWNWDFSNAALNWRTLCVLAYALMLFFFLPALAALRALRWNSSWLYPLLGAVLGFMGPVLLSFAGDGLLEVLRHPSALLVIFQSNQISHYQLGSSFASAITLSMFWIAAVWANPWYSARPQPAVAREAAG